MASAILNKTSSRHHSPIICNNNNKMKVTHLQGWMDAYCIHYSIPSQDSREKKIYVFHFFSRHRLQEINPESSIMVMLWEFFKYEMCRPFKDSYFSYLLAIFKCTADVKMNSCQDSHMHGEVNKRNYSGKV